LIDQDRPRREREGKTDDKQTSEVKEDGNGKQNEHVERRETGREGREDTRS